jgi:hypothetical protein
MTTPTNKAQVLQAIEQSHQDLVRVLASMSDEEKTAPILQDGWSVKDSLAHIVAWEKMTMDWLTRSLQGEFVRRYVPGFIYNSPEEQEPVMQALNQRLCEENRLRSLDDVLRDFRSTHRDMLNFIAGMNEKDIFDPDRFAWRNGSPALDMIGGNTYEHYAEHQGWILEWRAKAEGNDSAQSASTAFPAGILTNDSAITEPIETIDQLMAMRATPGLAKAELLQRVRGRHALMQDLVGALTREQMLAPVLDSGWSVKDSLAHLVEWETLLLDWVGKYQRGEEVKRWAEGYWIGEDDAEEQMHKFNAHLYEKNKNLELDDVLDSYRGTYDKVVDLLEGLSEDEIFDPDYFAARNGRPLITLIAGDSYEHYDEHIGWIRRGFALGTAH